MMIGGDWCEEVVGRIERRERRCRDGVNTKEDERGRFNIGERPRPKEMTMYLSPSAATGPSHLFLHPIPCLDDDTGAEGCNNMGNAKDSTELVTALEYV